MFDFGENNRALVFGTLLAGAAAKYCSLLWMSRTNVKKLEKIGKVSSLFLYPVKSFAGFPVDSARCTKLGLRCNGVTDRHWLVAMKDGNVLNMILDARTCLVRPSIHGDKLHLDAPDMGTLILPVSPNVETHKVSKVTIKTQTVDALDCGDEAAVWIQKFFNKSGLRLYHSAASLEKRQSIGVKKDWKHDAKPEDKIAFSSFGPYMVLSTDSLVTLNSKLEKPVPALNFRPNIMVEGCGEFGEDHWKEIRIGKVIFRPMDSCTRCVMTTVDLSTGKKSPNEEPLKTLKRFRLKPPYGPKPIFGRYFAADVEGDIKVNDDVYAVSS